MKNWEEIKRNLRRLAIAIKGSTNEEFPADLANLEDYIYLQLNPGVEPRPKCFIKGEGEIDDME